MTTIEGKPAAQWFKETKARQAKGQFDDKGAREAMQRMQGREMPEYDNQGRIVIGGSGGKYRYQPPPSKPSPTKASQPPSPAKPEPARQVAAQPKPQPQAKPAESNKPGRSQEHIVYGSATTWEEDRKAMKDRNNLIGSLRRNNRPIPKESPSANFFGILDTIQEQATRNNLRGMRKRGEEGERKMQWIANRRPAPGQAMGSESEWQNKLNAAKKSGQARSYVRRAEEARPKLFSMQAEARNRFKNAR